VGIKSKMSQERLSHNFYNRQIICMAVASYLKIKGLFVYTSKGFTLRCRIKILHQPFLFNLLFITIYDSISILTIIIKRKGVSSENGQV